MIAIATDGYRVCSKCGARKPLTEYQPDKRLPSGRINQCKDCVRARRRADWRRRAALLLAHSSPPPGPEKDTRPHVYAAKVASVFWGRRVTPAEIRRECEIARASVSEARKPLAGTQQNGALGGTDAAGAGMDRSNNTAA